MMGAVRMAPMMARASGVALLLEPSTAWPQQVQVRQPQVLESSERRLRMEPLP